MAHAISTNSQQQHPAPKPKRKNPYKDGFSKSAQQYDLYEMIRNPHAPKNKQPPPAASSLNPSSRISKQKKIELEVSSRFEGNSPTLFWNRFKLIGKISKLLFFILVTPFYLIFYLLPQMIFFKMIPFIVNYLAERVNNQINKFIAKIKNCINQVINPFRVLKKVLKPSLKLKAKDVKSALQLEGNDGFFAFIAMGIWSCLSPIINGFVRIHCLLKKTVLKIKETPRKIYKNFQQSLNRIQAFPSLIRKKIKNSLQYYSKLIKNKIKSFVRDLLLNPIRNFKQKVVTSLKNLKQHFKNSIKNFLSYLYSFKTKTNNFIEITKLRLIRGRLFLVAKIAAIKNSILSIINKVKVYLKQFNKKKEMTLQLYIKPAMNYTMTLPAISIQYTQTKMNLLLKKSFLSRQNLTGKINFFTAAKKRHLDKIKNYWLAKFNSITFFINKQLNKIKKPFIQLGYRISSRWYKFYSLTSTLLAKFSKKNYLFHKAKHLLSLFTNRFNHFKEKTVKTLQPILKKEKGRLDRFILNVRICLAWTKILTIYGMYQISLTCREIGLAL